MVFTVPLLVRVPRIERVDFSTSDVDPAPPLIISSLRRLLLVEICSSSSSHARTACEGIRLRFVVAVVTPCDFVGIIVIVEAELVEAELALALAPPLLLRAEDPLR